MRGLLSFDYFRKTQKDHIKTSLIGSFFSIFAISCMFILILSEFYHFFRTDIDHSLFVDTAIDPSENVPVNIDITIHDTPCSLVTLDVGMQNRLLHIADVPLTKTRINSNGGIIHGPSITFDINQIKNQIDSQEQCRLKGTFKISKAQGDFHFGSHPKNNFVQMLEKNQQMQCKFSFTLHHLSFGDQQVNKKVQKYFPDQASTISLFDGYSYKADSFPSVHAHNIKVTPMVFKNKKLRIYRTYGFYMHSRSGHIANHKSSSIYFLFDFEGVSEKYYVEQKHIQHLLVNLCAIIGGIFVVIGIFNSVIQKSLSVISRR